MIDTTPSEAKKNSNNPLHGIKLKFLRKISGYGNGWIIPCEV